MIVPKISEEPLSRRDRFENKLHKSDIAFICLPIKIGSEVIGTLSADRLSKEETTLEEDARLLAIIAFSISQAVPR